MKRPKSKTKTKTKIRKRSKKCPSSGSGMASASHATQSAALADSSHPVSVSEASNQISKIVGTEPKVKDGEPGDLGQKTSATGTSGNTDALAVPSMIKLGKAPNIYER